MLHEQCMWTLLASKPFVNITPSVAACSLEMDFKKLFLMTIDVVTLWTTIFAPYKDWLAQM